MSVQKGHQIGKQDATLAAVQALMDKELANIRRILDEQMFASTVSNLPPVPPTTRWQRLKRRVLWPVRWYLVTLWKALCGVDLVERDDDE